MQRLFSVFPNAWPGYGLLLLRLAAALSLLSGGTVAVTAIPLVAGIAEGAVGILMVIGLWTPAAAIALVLIHLACINVITAATGTTAVNVLLGLSLAMLGPGALSVDARLYGRKRLDL